MPIIAEFFIYFSKGRCGFILCKQIHNGNWKTQTECLNILRVFDRNNAIQRLLAEPKLPIYVDMYNYSSFIYKQ